ncbi:hypothetical protein [Streptomyces spiramyceticus]|uniref:hypothetical protein n=1 Tax=Streptomyces spiramyceticus TaxID=299717 RepID=UPI00237BD8DC|nr:hypothetical protein [Streptomyces spiramyceticus]
MFTRTQRGAKAVRRHPGNYLAFLGLAAALCCYKETADPVRLMRLFGITSHTAIHYVRAAHPECFTIDPTQA